MTAACRLKFGVLSDVHVSAVGTENLLEKAFVFFRDAKVDAVLLAGDIADWGLREQLERAAATWFKVFPDARRPDGAPVERLFVYGNHDHEGWKYGYQKRHKLPDEDFAPEKLISTDVALAWKTAFREEFAPIMLKEVKGFKFVLCQMKELKQADWAPFAAAHADELKREKVFFYTQHYHLKGTCSAPWTWGQDSGFSTQSLSAFPNCVAFSGHSHTPLTDERTIRQGDFGFTSVGTASLRYLIPFGGRENTVPFGSRMAPKSDKQMPNLTRESYKSHHGLVASVYDDRIVLERYDFETLKKLADDWTVPLGDYGALSYERRAKSAAVPEFPAGAKATVSEGEGKTMRGRTSRQVTVEFPTIPGDGQHPRAFDYEVTARFTEADLDKVAVQKRVFAYSLFRPAEDEEKTATCAFSREELPWDATVRFEIRPLNCFGAKGAPLKVSYKVVSDEENAKAAAKARKAAKKKAKAAAKSKAKSKARGED